MTKKLNLVGAAIRYPFKDLRWKDAFSMDMSNIQAQEFQCALGARAFFSWAIEARMAGINCAPVNRAMLNYNQALKNLERIEQM